MEGEAQVQTEAPATVDTPTEVTSQVEQPTESAQPDRPTGFDPVDVRTATPEQIEARINRLYSNVKKYEGVARKVPELEQANQILADQLRVLNEQQHKVINHIQVSDFNDAESQLKSQRQQAWQAGNSQLYDEANDKLRDLSVKRAIADMNAQQKPQQPVFQQPQMRPVSGEDIINKAVEMGSVTQDEASVYRTWMGETDEAGNTKRPWVNQTDPRNIAAASEGRAVFNNPSYQHLTFAQKLQEIDKRMGVRMPAQQQNVLPSGNLTRSVKNNNVKLTEYEERIAIKTKFGGSKAKSNADHAEAYRQAKIKSHQGGRQ